MKKLLIVLSLGILLGVGVWAVVFSRSGASGSGSVPSQAAGDSFARKLSLLTKDKEVKKAQTVEFSQAELDGYLYHQVTPLYPKGLQDVRIQLLEGSVQASSRLNFDEYEKAANAGKNSILSALLSGEHTLTVFADLKTGNHEGTYDVTKLLLDDKEIPKPLVDLLIQKYVVPKYPEAKPNSPFPLPYRIEKLDLLQGKLIVRQTP
ncbi:MAG: hypothetical protein U0V70_04895 [Terriglobia bacterium]